jgi:hypothetical protein
MNDFDIYIYIYIYICSDLPNAFWKRKQHIVDLPYENKLKMLC